MSSALLYSLLNQKLVKFAFVGGTATAIHFLILIALVEILEVNEVFASATAFIMSAAINYLLNFKVTFASRQKHSRTLPKFIAVAGFGLCANTLSFGVALSLIHNYLISQCIATLLVLILNYLLHRFWIYKEDIT